MSLLCLTISNSSHYIWNKIQSPSMPHKACEVMSDHILHLSPSWLIFTPNTHVFFMLQETVKFMLALGTLQLLFALPETFLSCSCAWLICSNHSGFCPNARMCLLHLHTHTPCRVIVCPMIVFYLLQNTEMLLSSYSASSPGRI